MPTTPTIPAGNLFMNATTYTGTGASLTVTNGVAGQSFQPDFVWIKSRSVAENHLAYDSVRGTNKRIYPNLTQAESTATDQFNSFNSNGFTLGADPSQQANITGATMVAWNWKAGGTAVSNTTGTITSSVSANQTSGFSVVTYTGTGSVASVGHGLSVLGVAPRMMIVKQRGSTTNWAVYHASMPSAFNIAGTQVMYLNATTANTQDFDVWESNNPSSTVFSVGASTLSNANGGTYVAYCWAPIAGYSAFGSYTGNGSTDGTFVYLGFRPRFVMVKRTDTAGYGWIILDTARNPYNVSGDYLSANTSDAENNLSGPDSIDFLSNGWKNRYGSYINDSGATYIYAAFAENPFKYANAR
jgi:hypothetical protein